MKYNIISTVINMYQYEDWKNFKIIDVLHFKRSAISYTTPKRSFCVISCRVNGNTTFTCDGADVYASKQDYIIIPPDIEYSQCSSDEEIICVHLFTKELHIDKIQSFHCVAPSVQQYFSELYSVWIKKDKGYLLKCKSVIYDILYALCSASENDDNSKQNNILQPAMNYIFENFRNKDFSVSQAINESHISPAYFRRIFKYRYNQTPVSFVNELRINYAKSLMKSKSYSLSEIVDMIGFSDEKYFYNVFKKVTGTTPSRWLS
ncbi:MAG: helix-turn-helix transcriptional regulator [Clostridia bacterium]|nr:helix-turn-helix transcriptional regulator [Clostridia bacterium]